MVQSIAIFLLTYIGYTYFTPLVEYKHKLPKPLSCGSCMSFWLVLITGLIFMNFWLAIIGACVAYLAYQLFYQYL